MIYMTLCWVWLWGETRGPLHADGPWPPGRSIGNRPEDGARHLLCREGAEPTCAHIHSCQNISGDRWRLDLSECALFHSCRFWNRVTILEIEKEKVIPSNLKQTRTNLTASQVGGVNTKRKKSRQWLQSSVFHCVYHEIESLKPGSVMFLLVLILILLVWKSNHQHKCQRNAW